MEAIQERIPNAAAFNSAVKQQPSLTRQWTRPTSAGSHHSGAGGHKLRHSVTNFGNIVNSSAGGAAIPTLRDSGYLVRPGNIIRENSEYTNSLRKVPAGGPIFYQTSHNRNPTLNETKASTILDGSLSNYAASPKHMNEGPKRARPQTANLRGSSDYALQNNSHMMRLQVTLGTTGAPNLIEEVPSHIGDEVLVGAGYKPTKNKGAKGVRPMSAAKSVRSSLQFRPSHHRRQRSDVLMMGIGGKVRKPEDGLALSITGQSVKQFVHKVMNVNQSTDARLQAYQAPHTVPVPDKLAVGKDFTKAMPKESFMVTEARRKKDMPPMNKYQNPAKWKWSKMNEADLFQKWTTSKHKTYIAQIFVDAKEERIIKPGPTTYNQFRYQKFCDNISLNKMKPSGTPQLQMLDDARYQAGQAPAVGKYKINYASTERRPQSAQYYPKTREKNQQIKGSRGGNDAHIIKKKDGPAPGTYKELDKAFAKTQERNTEFAFKKGKKIGNFEEAANREKYKPGVGTYTKYETAFNQLSSPPTSLRRRR